MSYTVREVAAMLGLTPSQVRAYAARGFLEPECGNRGELRFGFRDLIILRTAGELVAAHIPQRKVRRALERLREQLPAGRALTGVRITADGERVVVRDGEAVWNPESGQSLFDFAVAELAAKATPIGDTATTEHEHDADAWYDLACDLEVASPAEARAAYQRAIELDPDHADAHVNLGRMLHEEGAPAAAEQHYRRALDADPEHPTAAFNLGVALEDLGRIREALEAYERAVVLDPENCDVHYNLAGILERRGDKAGALRHLKEYRKLKEGE
ncbi:MAG TPA: tetratricopeptide repeat protein [Thermoanaerobaculia bacterium]|nr:tetratricopeptide repeat protein [Thermoanaerobaculia bacterium]